MATELISRYANTYVQGFLFCAGLGWAASPLSAQSFHTPAELLSIIEHSELRYNIAEVDCLVATAWPLQLNDCYTYQVEQSDGLKISRFAPDATVTALLERGEDAFRTGNLKEAQGYFEQVITRDPGFAVAHTYLGQSAYGLGDLEAAQSHLQDAIELNYWDFLAHLSLANVHLRGERHDAALQEAATAFVLNPNDDLVQKETKRVFEHCGLGFRDFIFHPNYNLSRQGADVQINMSLPWLMYAVCKAIWKYEPGYRKHLESGGSRDFNLNEEKECLLNLAVSLREMRRKELRDPALHALMDALDARMLEQFIVVELWLHREPLIIYTQPKAVIPGLAEYVVNIRGVGKRR